MDTTDAGKTEAELQARFKTKLADALPFLPAGYKLERHIYLQIGHQRIVIDGLKPVERQRGRYDMLVEVEGKPVLLAEFKAPDVALTDVDIDQARSYAALVPVPLFLVSNGTTTTLHYTNDKSIIAPTDIAACGLSKLVENAARLAASNNENAIRTLLGSSEVAWKEIFSRWSTAAIDA